MEESDVIEILKELNENYFQPDSEGEFDDINEALDTAILLIEETKQYRALGTVEELKIAKEKQIPKKPIEKVTPYSEEVGFNSEWHCPCCESYTGYFTEGMSEPEQNGIL